MQITKITEQVKNSSRASIFVDGKYSFSLDLDQLLQTKLKVGQILSERELMMFKKMSKDGKIRMKAIEWLILRPRSEFELKNYLKRKNVDQELIDKWVDSFKKRNFQNDKTFAKWWVEQRQVKGRSTKSIVFELRRKGVDSETITTALNGSENGESKSLELVIRKKRRQARYQDNKKLTEYLLRQGFSYSEIKKAISKDSS